MNDATAYLTIEQLRSHYKCGSLTVAAVVERALQRIAQLDRAGPCLNAMITTSDTALAEARARDAELANVSELAPLHGVPIVLKDNINIAGMPTTGGCAALAELYPTRNAVVTERLLAAGAVVLGKASMSEFAWGTYDTENSIVDGFTRNPYQLDYACGGSSGGTAVAIAAGYCAGGLGTDTGCSVRAPASINNLVGLRPTHGGVDMRGIMPMNADWDTVGPLARTTRDLLTLFNVMRDQPASDVLDSQSDGMSIGIVRQLACKDDCHAEIIALLDQAVVDFTTARVRVHDAVESAVFTQQIDIEDWYLRFRFDLDGFLHDMAGDTPYPTLAAILSTDTVLARYRPALESSLAWPHLPAAHPRLARMHATRQLYRKALQGLLDDFALDALAFPTFRYPPVRNGSLDGDRPGAGAPVGSNNYFASLTGYPAVSIPMGFTAAGLPVGLQLLGRPNSETRLIQIAARLEQVTQHQRAPVFDGVP